MYKNRIKPNSSHRQFLITLIVLMSLMSFSILAGCTAIPSTDAPISSPELTLTPEPTAPISPEAQAQSEHSIQMNPEALTVSDKSYTLEGYGSKGAIADQDMSYADMLMYAVQDEYLAHGEYVAIINEFGNANPYANIIQSEETHIALLKQAFDAYGFEFPGDDSEEHLVVPKDLLEAAQTGVQAEIDNITMYEKFLENDLPKDIADVFTSLKNASESHLLAFQKQVDKLN